MFITAYIVVVAFIATTTVSGRPYGPDNPTADYFRGRGRRNFQPVESGSSYALNNAGLSDDQQTNSFAGSAPNDDQPTNGFAGSASSDHRPTNGFAGSASSDHRPTIGYAGPAPSDHQPRYDYAGPAQSDDQPTSGYANPAPSDDKPTNGYAGPAPSDDQPTNGFAGPTPSDNQPANDFIAPAPNDAGHPPSPRFEAFYPRSAYGVVGGQARPAHGHATFYQHRHPALIDANNSPAYGFRFDGKRRFNFD